MVMGTKGEDFFLPVNTPQRASTQESACQGSRQRISPQQRCINWEITGNGGCPQENAMEKTKCLYHIEEQKPKYSRLR